MIPTNKFKDRAIKNMWLGLICLLFSLLTLGIYYQQHLMAASLLTFTDQTQAANLTATHMTTNPNGIRNMISGMTAADFDGDGWVDLFVLGGGATADSLFINQGDGTFQEEAAQWGLAAIHQGAGAATGDFNHDGWIDLYVTSHGPGNQPTKGQHRLYRNNGDRTFTNIATTAGVNQTNDQTADGYGAVFGDYDLDGDLDLL